jgi:hypothetical protein
MGCKTIIFQYPKSYGSCSCDQLNGTIERHSLASTICDWQRNYNYVLGVRIYFYDYQREYSLISSGFQTAP